MKISRVVKRSGGDKPKWDADMEYWLNGELTVNQNKTYRSPNTLLGWSENIIVKGLGITGTINNSNDSIGE